MKHASRILCLAGLAGALAAGPALAAESVRAIAFIPKNHPVMTQAQVWVDEINAGLAGDLRINYVGGPEVISRYQQIEALRNGVLDIVITVTADYQDQIPEVSAFTLSKLSPAEERKSGFYDLMVGLHEKINARYIGRVQYSPFYLWTKKNVRTLADLEGLKMRTGSLYDRFMRALGMVPVTISSRETYTALERGVVDGFGWPTIGPRQRGWLKNVKYRIDLPFFHPSNMVALMNLDRWKKLSDGVQKKIVDITAAFEPRMVAHFVNQNKLEDAALAKFGLNRVTFSPAENKRYLDTAYNVEWAAIAERAPGTVDKLRKLSGN